MTSISLIKKLGLTEEAVKQINTTVESCEKKTTGEIVVAITPESEKYSFYELFFSLVVGIVVFAALIIAHESVINWLETKFWNMPSWAFAVFVGSISFLAIAVSFFVTNILVIDRKIIPKSVQYEAVTKRAIRTFAECHVHNTKNQTGILIFISYLEKEVRVLADSGIAAKISQDNWNEITLSLANELTASIKARSTASNAICHAIEKCGVLLAEHFPKEEGNQNELENALVILEGGE